MKYMVKLLGRKAVDEINMPHPHTRNNNIHLATRGPNFARTALKGVRVVHYSTSEPILVYKLMNTLVEVEFTNGAKYGNDYSHEEEYHQLEGEVIN